MLTQLNLQKLSFKHSYTAPWVFHEVELMLTPGLYGLFGPNGSGKSTLLKCISGIHQTYSGKINFTLQDQYITHQRFKERLGYAPQEFSFYEEMKVETYLRYIADMKLIPRKQTADRIQGLINRFEMYTFLKSPIDSLSTGQRKRLMLIQALLTDPHLILLDEPLEGLDVEERNRVMEQLHDLAEQRIIIIASHIIAEIEPWLEQVIFMTDQQVSAPKTPAYWKICMLHEQEKARNGQMDFDIDLLGGRDPVNEARSPTLEDVYLWVSRK